MLIRLTADICKPGIKSILAYLVRTLSQEMSNMTKKDFLEKHEAAGESIEGEEPVFSLAESENHDHQNKYNLKEVWAMYQSSKSESMFFFEF